MKFKPKHIKHVTTVTRSGKVVSRDERIVTEQRCQFCGKTDRELHDAGKWGLYDCADCGITVCYGCSKHEEAIRHYQGKDGNPALMLYINPKKMPWYSGEVRQTGSEVHFCEKCHKKHDKDIALLHNLIKAHEELTEATTKETARLSKVFFPKGYQQIWKKHVQEIRKNK